MPAENTFPQFLASYSQVCGQLIRYQFGTTDGFEELIRDDYWNGASITYRSSQKHTKSYELTLLDLMEI